MIKQIVGVLCAMVLVGSVGAEVKPGDEAFKKQWYAGLAEITRYELRQARYRDVHDGDAVLIFVTEDFLTKDHVKHERGDGESVSILKLNFTRNFTTGIYPYSMMTSTFTPVGSNQRTLKATTSVQEWCGHTFTQMNYRNEQYHGILRSYFQSEGDRNFVIGGILEDEIWTRIRLAPEQLPIGEVQLIPGLQFQRLAHVLPQEQTATTEMVRGETTQTYNMVYSTIPRKLSITFEKAYPHSILSWEESYQRRGKWTTTMGKKTHTIMLDYWGKNSAADSTYRAQLGLE
ncbi:MAG: septum formation inhibitor Maf [Candidatus Latescibacteria bacterium]|jgi:hypothetical protein|nr:septum formation inhibitor Maf [Candidatus Latescibacterota bacterium]MBT5832931.1 septum formation inhibitor Maf [Candidatus Latescibacterota bacterium]